MPRKKRESKARNRELEVDEFMELACGDGGKSVFENDFIRRAAWNRHREEVMEFAHAGSRPFAWFKYEAPEPRRITGRKPLEPPFPSPAMIAQARTARVKCKCGEWHIGEICIFETDLEYLTRLNLLEPWEVAELKAMDSIKA